MQVMYGKNEPLKEAKEQIEPTAPKAGKRRLRPKSQALPQSEIPDKQARVNKRRLSQTQEQILPADYQSIVLQQQLLQQKYQPIQPQSQPQPLEEQAPQNQQSPQASQTVANPGGEHQEQLQKVVIERRKSQRPTVLPAQLLQPSVYSPPPQTAGNRTEPNQQRN